MERLVTMLEIFLGMGQMFILLVLHSQLEMQHLPSEAVLKVVGVVPEVLGEVTVR